MATSSIPASNRNQYQSAYVQAPLPTVQQEQNDVALNMTLTVPETMLLAFFKATIHSALKDKNDLIYLGTSEPMQRSFSEWAGKTFTNRKFSPEELKLDTIVASIWSKVKTFNDNQLRASNNLQAISDEINWQIMANNFETQCRPRGHTGKFFTARQAMVLLKAAEVIT